MAFPAVAATATTNGTTATASAAVNLPTGIASGDLLVVLHRSAIGTASHAVSGGGWTNLFNSDVDASDDRISLWYRVADGTEGATITIAQTNSKFASLALRVTGHAAGIAPQFAALVTGTSATPDPGSLAPSGGAKDYLWLWLGGWEGEQTSPPAGTPTNYTDALGANSGTAGVVATNVRVANARRNLNAASEDPGSWTISVSDDWTATVLAVHPAVLPSGIASAEAFGSARLVMLVAASGIPSGEAIGSHTILTGGVTLSPTGIASSEAFGVLLFRLALAPGGIASAEAFGSHRTRLAVAPSGIASAEALGTALLGLRLAPIGLASAEAFGSQRTRLGLAPVGIVSAEVLGSPTASVQGGPVGWHVRALSPLLIDVREKAMALVTVASATRLGPATTPVTRGVVDVGQVERRHFERLPA